MNKNDYFAELSRFLSGLSEAERQDIVRDLEEYFYEASQRGQSDAEIIEKLGSPKKMADTIVAEAKIKRISTASTVPQKISAILAATLAIIVLTPINFIFVFVPLLFVAGILMGLWSLATVLVLTLPIVVIFVLLEMFHVVLHIFALLCLFFFAIGWGGMVLAVVIGLVLLTVLIFKAIVKVFQWNINIIKNQMRG